MGVWTVFLIGRGRGEECRDREVVRFSLTSAARVCRCKPLSFSSPTCCMYVTVFETPKVKKASALQTCARLLPFFPHCTPESSSLFSSWRATTFKPYSFSHEQSAAWSGDCQIVLFFSAWHLQTFLIQSVLINLINKVVVQIIVMWEELHGRFYVLQNVLCKKTLKVHFNLKYSM